MVLASYMVISSLIICLFVMLGNKLFHCGPWLCYLLQVTFMKQQIAIHTCWRPELFLQPVIYLRMSYFYFDTPFCCFIFFLLNSDSWYIRMWLFVKIFHSWFMEENSSFKNGNCFFLPQYLDIFSVSDC